MRHNEKNSKLSKYLMAALAIIIILAMVLSMLRF